MPQYQGIWSLQSAAQLQSTQRWVTDPLFENTTLLLQADNAANGAQNNTFLDSSTNNFTITRNGNTTQGTFTPFSATGWGNYFSGAGSYLSNTSAALVGSTVSTFTAEAWIYMTAAPTSDANNIGSVVSLDGQANGTFNYMAFGPISNQRLFLRWFDGAGKTCNGSTVLALNTWYHIVVVVNSNAIAMYVNGLPETLSGTTTLTNRNGTSNEFAIATNNYTSFSGYISNVRVTNTAVYTSAFTPSTIPLTSPSGTLLLTSQSNRFVDTNTQAAAKTLTPAGSATSVQAFSPFAPQYQYTPSVTGGSGYFDGTGDYLQIAGGTNAALGSGNFTVECWINPSTVAPSYQIFYDDRSSGVNGPNLSIMTQGAALTVFSNNVFVISGGTIAANTWNHVAVVKSGSTLTAYLNGVSVGSASDTVTYTCASDRPIIGCSGFGINTYNYTGYISNLRVVKGTAVYTSGFTPPTSPVTAITNTALLTNFTNAGIYDGTLKNNLETVGNAQVSTSVVKYGTGSMYFDGTGDYLTVPANAAFNFGTGNFTIEFWLYFQNSTGAQTIFDISYTTSPNLLFQASSGAMAVYMNGASTVLAASAVSNGTWNHFALVRSGTTVTLYLNGVSVSSATYSGNVGNSTSIVYVGGSLGGGGYYLNGYIDDLRITAGIARYTANFTPPTVALPRQ